MLRTAGDGLVLSSKSAGDLLFGSKYGLLSSETSGSPELSPSSFDRLPSEVSL